MGRGRYCAREVVPFIGMVMGECTDVGLNTIFKAATLKGLDYHVFMVYTYAISTLFAIPLIFIFHRDLPPIRISFIIQMFLLAILGFIAQMIGYKGIEYASPTLGSAMSNLTPACTFVFAIIFRMEKLEIRRLSSQAKVIGTIVSISGALVVVLYKGPTIITSVTPSTSLNSLFDPSTYAQSQWLIGGGLLALEYVIISVWYILQAKVLNEYPAELVVYFLYNLSCTIVSTPVCLIAQSNWSTWKIKANIGLAAILYSGIIGSFGNIIHIWGLHVKGPVYVALFKPLSIAIAAVMGVILLGDAFCIGSIIGAIIISFGFYVVIWAKTQEEEEEEEEEEDVCEESSPFTEQVPLLQGYNGTASTNEGQT
ncbi:hypothetical protein LguiB_011299 [Lonicera macranthoides]